LCFTALSDLSFVWTNDQSNYHLDVCDACPGVCGVENNKKSKPKTRKTGLWSAQLPFSFLRCSAGILPALLLLVSPFSGTDPAGRRPVKNDVCAPLLRRNPSNLGVATASHSMNARGEAQARPTKTKSLIANPELEFSLSSITTAAYNFLIAKNDDFLPRNSNPAAR
jgi:hypothetical protein